VCFAGRYSNCHNWHAYAWHFQPTRDAHMMGACMVQGYEGTSSRAKRTCGASRGDLASSVSGCTEPTITERLQPSWCCCCLLLVRCRRRCCCCCWCRCCNLSGTGWLDACTMHALDLVFELLIAAVMLPNRDEG
jgi:hypothetical protein